MQKITIRRDPNKRNGKEYPRWITQWRVNGKIKTVYLGSCAKMTEAEAQAKAEQLKNGNGVTDVIPNTIVWCSDCATKFSIPPTERNIDQTCPKCGRNVHIHYMPVSPGTIEVPRDVFVGRIMADLLSASEQLKGKKFKYNTGLSKSCFEAYKIIEEARSTGVIEDLPWCPSCEKYMWNAKNKRYYYPKDDKLLEYAPGAACDIKRY